MERENINKENRRAKASRQNKMHKAALMCMILQAKNNINNSNALSKNLNVTRL